MSDKAGIVQDDELQKEFESARRRQSLRDAAAADDDEFGPPSRVIRSYDREVVGHDASDPPSYCDDVNDVAAKHELQVNQQQAARCGGYGRQSGQAHQQQFQQPPPQQPAATRVIRPPANYHVVRQAMSGWWMWRLVVAVVGSIIAIIFLIAFGIYKAVY